MLPVANVSLIESSGGVFEITAAGTLVYSKKQTGHFPDEAELLQQLRERAG